jgi:hypothetical protein
MATSRYGLYKLGSTRATIELTKRSKNIILKLEQILNFFLSTD